jgi:hypothetical protein
MKSKKVKEILDNSDKMSYDKNYDLSESCFSYSEVLDLIRLSDEELFIKDSKISICENLMSYLESKIRIIDLPKMYYSDEISMLIEISESDDNLISEKIFEFKNIF